MKANETNFIALIRQKREEGILYVIDTYGGYLHAIVRQRLSALPDQIDECMNDIFWESGKTLTAMMRTRAASKTGSQESHGSKRSIACAGQAANTS